MVHTDDNTKERGVLFLTSGNYVVTSVESWDEEDGVVYYIGTVEGKPGVRHLYSVRDDGSEEGRCETCTIKVRMSQSCKKALFCLCNVSAGRD